MNLDLISVDEQALAYQVSQTLTKAVSDRNENLVYDLLVRAELSGDDEPLSAFESFFLGCWNALFDKDRDGFLWLGYVLSAQTGNEKLLAYFFIARFQRGFNDPSVTE